MFVCVGRGGGATLCSTTPVFHFNGPKGPRIPLNCFPPYYAAKFTLLGHHRQTLLATGTISLLVHCTKSKERKKPKRSVGHQGKTEWIDGGALVFTENECAAMLPPPPNLPT